MKARFSFFFILLGLSGSLILRAQQAPNFHVAGLVHDATGSVLPGAEVDVRLAATNAPLSQVTDGQGHFADRCTRSGQLRD